MTAKELLGIINQVLDMGSGGPKEKRTNLYKTRVLRWYKKIFLKRKR